GRPPQRAWQRQGVQRCSGSRSGQGDKVRTQPLGVRGHRGSVRTWLGIANPLGLPPLGVAVPPQEPKRHAFTVPPRVSLVVPPLESTGHPLVSRQEDASGGVVSAA